MILMDDSDLLCFAVLVGYGYTHCTEMSTYPWYFDLRLAVLVDGSAWFRCNKHTLLQKNSIFRNPSTGICVDSKCATLEMSIIAGNASSSYIKLKHPVLVLVRS